MALSGESSTLFYVFAVISNSQMSQINTKTRSTTATTPIFLVNQRAAL